MVNISGLAAAGSAVERSRIVLPVVVGDVDRDSWGDDLVDAVEYEVRRCSGNADGSGLQVSGGPARAVHVERRGVMLVGNLPARRRPAKPDGRPEPQVYPLTRVMS
jgi:hypothetical protein